MVSAPLLCCLPCAAYSPAPEIVTYHPMKPEVFFFSDVPGKVRSALLPPELVRPLLSSVLDQLGGLWGREMADFVVLSRAYLERYPMAPDAPVRHHALVLVLERMAADRSASHEERCSAGRQALSERWRMAENYAVASEWRRMNEAGSRTIGEADEIVHVAMMEAAMLLHRKAQNIRMVEADGKVSGASRPWYCRAQRAYIELIGRFPDGREQCNVRRGIGEAAFFGTWNVASRGRSRRGGFPSRKVVPSVWSSRSH